MLNQMSTSAFPEESMLTALVPVWDSGEETLFLPQHGDFVCGSAADCAATISLSGVAEQHCRMVCCNGSLTIEPAECLGACDFAPCVLANDDLLKNLEAAAAAAAIEAVKVRADRRSTDGSLKAATQPREGA